MYFYIIKYVYSFHHTHISVRHFVGVFVYAGAINRPLRLLTDCQNVADGLPFCGYIHICGRDKSAPTAANGLPKHCERIAKTLRTDCHFVGVFIYAGTINPPLRLLTVCQNIADGLPFCGYIHICGHDKSAPTAANGLPITLRTICGYVMFV